MCVYFIGYSVFIGIFIVFLMLFGGLLVLRVVVVIGGVVGVLLLIVVCVFDGKFLIWGGFLVIGFGGVCMVCLGRLIIIFTYGLE